MSHNGKIALGNYFYLPFQDSTNNLSRQESPAISPVPFARTFLFIHTLPLFSTVLRFARCPPFPCLSNLYVLLSMTNAPRRDFQQFHVQIPLIFFVLYDRIPL